MEKKPIENGHIDNVTKNGLLEECDHEKVEVLKVRKKKLSSREMYAVTLHDRFSCDAH